MMRVGLMAPGFSPLDAVGNDLLGMVQALGAKGIKTLIFTPTGESGAALPVLHYRDAQLLLDEPEDILIYHYCVADSAGLRMLRQLRCRIIIRYHNVTPASLMSQWSAEFGRTCRLGRAMLNDLAEMAVDGFLAASAFNAAELLQLGINAERVHVLPPLHRCDELLGQRDDPGTERLLERNTYNLLAVGRLVPNKGFDVMAESFGAVMRWANLDIHLHHVGTHDPRLQNYTDHVGGILVREGVRHRFTFHGQADVSVLATLYRHCDLFWTTSLHEGFCVPAVEAMAFGLPILSSRYTALPETCADAALFANSTVEIAEQLHAILCDDRARAHLGHQARRRYEEYFRPGHLRGRFAQVLDKIIEQSERRIVGVDLDRSGDWFRLPRHEELILPALNQCQPMPPYGLTGADRRRDIVDYALQNEAKLASVEDYLASRDVREYALEIEMPKMARHLGPELRLIWEFNRTLRAQFDLLDVESVSAFRDWFERHGQLHYASLNSAMRVAALP